MASGIEPIPIWSVPPSSANLATCSPMVRSSLVMSWGAGERNGSSTSTARSIHSVGSSPSPKV